MSAAVERVLDAARGKGLVVRSTSDGHMLQCPGHDDSPHGLSLHVSEGEKGAVLWCHAGCVTEDVAAELGLTMRDLFSDNGNHPSSTVVAPLRPMPFSQRVIARLETVCEYVYVDERGAPVVKVVRYAELDESGAVVGKTFMQFRREGELWVSGLRRGTTTPLYRLPEVLAAVREGKPILVVEGEKDADRLRSLGHVATTCAMGAGKWRPEHTETLRGAVVAVVPDQDEPGRKHGRTVVRELESVARMVVVLLPAEGCKDVSDHLDAGHALSELRPVTLELPAENVTRKVRLTPATDITPRPVRWLWEERIPVGETTLTPGRAGIGKSTFHCWLVAELTTGKLPGVYFGTPRACVIAASEDSWSRTIVPRLIAAGADLSLVFRADVVEGMDAEGTSLTLPADCSALAIEVARIDAVLISIDPLLSTIHGSLNTHHNRDVRQALEPLGRLADRTGAVILGNAHFNKSNNADPLSLITGSSAFGEVIRAALGFARDPDAEDGSCVVSQIKNNLGKTDLPSLRYHIEPATVSTPEGPADVGVLRWLGESERSVRDILSERDDGDDRAERDEAARWLTAYLADNGGEAAAVDVYRAGARDGYSKDQLKRVKKKARVTSEKAAMDAGWMWRLDHEGSAKGAKGAASETVLPSHPSALPSADPCRVCGEALDRWLSTQGYTTHPTCEET